MIIALSVKRKYKLNNTVQTEKKGWGLQIHKDLKAGDFIIEYVGEVISNDLCLERMKDMEDDGKFYYLTLDQIECIDARKMGNMARFINHSCSPNCQTQKWSVTGENRVGIFALKDIKAFTELTFDYQFERFGAKKQVCYCGEDNCRGYLGEKPKQMAKNLNKDKKDAGDTYIPKVQKTFIADHYQFISEIMDAYKPQEYNEYGNSRKRLKKNKVKGYYGYEMKNSPLPFLHRNVRHSLRDMMPYYDYLLRDNLDILEDDDTEQDYNDMKRIDGSNIDIKRNDKDSDNNEEIDINNIDVENIDNDGEERKRKIEEMKREDEIKIDEVSDTSVDLDEDIQID